MAINWEIGYEELILGEEIGRGVFGKVFKGEWRSQQVAVKQLIGKEFTDKQLQDFRTEAQLYCALRPHAHVVQFYGVCTHADKPLCIVTEFCDLGNLLNLLKKDHSLCNVKQLSSFARDCARGMLHLHEEHIVHRDLAARNLLVTKHLEVKVSDFGMSRFNATNEEDNSTESTVGPLKWMSPEAILKQTYSTSSDVWSFGVVLYEIFTQSPPYQGMTAVEAGFAVSKEGKRLKLPDSVPQPIHHLMVWCLNSDPALRPPFKTILQELNDFIKTLN